MISIIIPTRGRPELLIDSLRSLAPGDYEVLLYMDQDDARLKDYRFQLNAYNMEPTVFMGKRLGYYGFHTMVNKLCGYAKGDLLMLYNDDTLMQTKDWTTIIYQYLEDKDIDPLKDPAVFNIINPLKNYNLFPVITRDIYETMGHFSLTPHCDSWVQDVANALDRHYFIPGIDVVHLREMVWDDTKLESQQAYDVTSPLHYSEKNTKLIEADIQKIRNKERV